MTIYSKVVFSSKLMATEYCCVCICTVKFHSYYYLDKKGEKKWMTTLKKSNLIKYDRAVR